MPTNKEIAEWLREAAEAIGEYASISNFDFTGKRKELLGVIHKTKDRAALVEQMRCETCRLRVNGNWCEKYNQHILGMNDSCCHWEEKNENIES
jgi:hypothetical protein